MNDLNARLLVMTAIAAPNRAVDRSTLDAPPDFLEITVAFASVHEWRAEIPRTVARLRSCPPQTVAATHLILTISCSEAGSSQTFFVPDQWQLVDDSLAGIPRSLALGDDGEYSWNGAEWASIYSTTA